ncbi:hypothetical protein KIN20_011240 [Parelaphostrongylus tenuis]|uniref:Uncharacterized protein n=1 Tax=Parelaphostrongylus tenuis TaxID=148309 RepID=A0AAD5MTD2_PARTN|nr:hypothetical protein KIN20_011240 [Parelaphostrongylus tenuis]
MFTYEEKQKKESVGKVEKHVAIAGEKVLDLFIYVRYDFDSSRLAFVRHRKYTWFHCFSLKHTDRSTCRKGQAAKKKREGQEKEIGWLELEKNANDGNQIDTQRPRFAIDGAHHCILLHDQKPSVKILR